MEIKQASHRQFLFLYTIALADFHMHPTEIAFLKEFGEKRGVTEEEIEHFLMNPAQFDQEVPDTLEERIESLYHLARMIWADGMVADEERQMLERFCGTFGFKQDNVAAVAEFLLKRAEEKVDVEQVVKEALSES